jgi:hypothetical protein
MNIRTTSAFYSPRRNAQALLKRLFFYLIEIKAFNPPKPKAIKKPYNWILDPYLRYLRDECELSELDPIGGIAGDRTGFLGTWSKAIFAKSPALPYWQSSVISPLSWCPRAQGG